MPKTKRDILKRTVAQAVNHIEEAEIDILGLKETFDKPHPELAKLLDVIMQALEQVIAIITSFCLQAWGTAPQDWYTWRNPGTPRKKEKDG